jgi:hypothetical protein
VQLDQIASGSVIIHRSQDVRAVRQFRRGDLNSASPAVYILTTVSDQDESITLAVECYVELAGIRIDPSLLGRSITVKRHPCAYRIDLPKEPDSFEFTRATTSPSDPVHSFVGTPERGFVEIRIVRIVVNAKYRTRDVPVDRGSSAHDQWAQEVFFDLRAQALDAARDLTHLVRLRGQADIEPTGRYPHILNVATLLELDETEARSFGWAIGQAATIQILGDDEILDEQQLDLIESDLNRQRATSVGELFVGEALYLAQSGQRNGPAQATLLAAMGVEVYTKDVLRHLVDNASAPLLDLLLENPRDWSAAAYSLFSKALPTIASTNLGEEHKLLSKRVQKLFEARNRLAHRGEAITTDEAKQHVTTAKAAVTFLRELVSPLDTARTPN